MTQRSFFSLVGVLAVSLDWLLFRIYRWIQVGWEEPLRLSGHMPRWWLTTGLVLALGYAGIVGLLLMLAHKYLKARLTRVAVSVLIDTSMTIALWILSTVFDDPLLKSHLVTVGLSYLPALFFWGGALWLVIGIARVGILVPLSRGKLGTDGTFSDP